MQPLPEDPWLIAITITLLASSVATWVFLILLKLRRGRILSYEPRRPVPWGPLGAMLAVVFVILAISSGLSGQGPPEVPPEPPPAAPSSLETAQDLFGMILFQAVLSGAVVFVVVAISRANLHDLGLPAYADEFARDVGIGVMACLAALVPVFGLQFLVMSLLGEPEEFERNPLIEMVTREPHFGVLLLASVAAVVMAPLSEEIVFRLLLQGWLEKWEDSGNDEARMTNDECQTTNDQLSPCEDSSFVIRHSSLPNDPPRHGLFGLAHGRAPILISSVLFALAHFGYGPDPVPLFVFALVLGYVYQRTHRIVPGIVAHALFNMVTMLILWRMVMIELE
jgi:membrane protease YdiL (CAAX protease family)